MPIARLLLHVNEHRPIARQGLSRLSLVFTALALAPLLAGCQISVLDPRGPVGTAEKTILLDALAIMLSIVIPTAVATLVFAWWFRAGNLKARYRPEFVYSGRIELVVWSIPVLVVLFLGGIAWIGSHDLDPARAIGGPNQKPLEVQVVSLDWKWLFIYPDEGIAAVNELVVPADMPVHFALTSASVMNAFFVPQLGGMIYTMNGMTTQLYLQADAPGDFHGLSSHFSGDGFSDMHFQMKAVSNEAFQDWVRTARGSAQALDADSYETLAKQSTNVAPATFRVTDPTLFQSIVTQKIAPGPGPQQGAPTPAVTPKSGG